MHRRIDRHHASTVAIAAALAALGLAGGGYSVTARSLTAIGVWLTVLVLVALSIWPRAPLPRSSKIVGVLFAAFAAFTGLSALWASSAEGAFLEFGRVALYLGVFALVILATRFGDAPSWINGLGIGIVAVGLLALAQRCFPNAFPAQDLARLVPDARGRLSYPVGYWNGLGILVAMAFPLLLAAATLARRALWRGAALAPLPALAGVMYMTSSRGGVAVLAAGVVAFVVLTDRRVAAVVSVVVVAAASVIVLVALAGRHALVDDLATPAATSEGRSAAVICVICALGTGIAWALLSGRVRELRLPRLRGRAVAALAVLVAIAGFVAADPAARLRTFKAPPTGLVQPGSFIQAHLLSGSGSGRWQFWQSALDQFSSRPLAGQGAGSYESWWYQHASFSYTLRNAHSLYLETLGELGIVGFVLLVGVLIGGLVAGVRRLRGRAGDDRVPTAALTATLLAFAVGAAIDWIWQLTVAGVVGVVCVALLVGPATINSAPGAPTLSRARGLREPRSLGATATVVLAAWLLICAEAIPWLAQREVRASQTAERSGNSQQALARAEAARTIQPWASSPYLQLALVAEQGGNLPLARESIGQAIDRDFRNWRLWVVRARIETRSGSLDAARTAIDRARLLNPRFPLFATGKPGS